MPHRSKHAWPMPAWTTPLLVAVIGLALSVLGFIAVRNATVAEIRGQFEEDATRRLGELQDAVNINTTLLRSIEGLYAASEFVSREEFEIFVRNQPLMRSGRGIVAWVPRVRIAERESFVAQARRDGVAGFQVWPAMAEGAADEERVDLFPIRYVEPLEGNELLRGFDLASDPEYREALARARDYGEAAATGLMHRLPVPGERGSVLIAYPRYKSPLPPHTPAERRNELIGYAIGMFSLSGLFAESLGAETPHDVGIYIYDLSAVPLPVLLYASGADTGGGGTAAPALDTLLESYHWSGSIDVGGHTWFTVFKPPSGYPPALGDWRAWITAVFGIFLTGLLTAYEWRRSTHTRRIETLAADLSRSYAQLERETAERMRAEDQLRQSQKLEVVGKLTGGVAHDFNNLLTIILGNLETAAERAGKSGPVAAQLKTAINAAIRGAALTQRLLAFARRQVLKPENLNLNKVVDTMLELLRRSLGPPIVVETSLAKNLWPALADRSEVENALLNLAINARDAMPSGGTLTIKTGNVSFDTSDTAEELELMPGDYVVVTVSDTGVGMTPDTRERAIEPFFTTKEPGKGTGLGLSSVYGFARQSGGHLRIASELGSGTTVRLYLPRARGTEAGAAEEAPRAQDYAGHETILLAEDEPEVRAVTAAHLSESGYRVVQARDAAAALKAGGGSGIDLLLTDEVLAGGMDGHDLAAALRDRYPGLKVVYMSGYSEHGRARGAGQEPGYRLLQKPFRKNELLGAVRAALDSGAGA